MKVRVRLFAAARQLVGTDAVAVELPEHATVAELRRAMSAEWPGLEALLPQSLLAIDAEYVDNATVLQEGVEVACIPPVSGG